MTNETLTAKTKNGQVVTFQYGQYKTVKKQMERNGSLDWYVELTYEEAVRHLNVPTALKGKEIAIKIVEQDKVAALWNAQWDREQAEKEAVIDSGKIVGFHYVIGCDCGDELWFVYDNDDNVDFIAVTIRRREKDQILAKTVAELVDGKIPQNIPSNLGSYGGWDIEMPQLQLLLDVAIGTVEEKEVEEKKIMEVRRAAKQEIIEKAKITGEKQELSRYSADCSRIDYDCDQDIVVTNALPNGSTETVRSHCH